ncbi:MAG: hypothetical protein GX914_07215 [Erysipelotrichia bacterium]|nr:hypothetical protein [Erysipelotrichia bacterium]
MEKMYLNMLVDITDPKCDFINTINKEIENYGAIVYNYQSNSYQFIRKFSHIDYKTEVLPDLIKVENSDALLNGLNLSIHYEFDPETEEDEENLDIWYNDISQIELPVYNYDDDGDIYLEKYVPIDTSISKHTLWYLNKDSYDYILDLDLLMLTPVIKNINIARELIKKYSVHPFEFKADQQHHLPDHLKGVYGHHQHDEDCQCEDCLDDLD